MNNSIFRKNIWLIICSLLVACEKTSQDISTTDYTGNKQITLSDLSTGTGMPANKLGIHSESLARDLIETLGQQQTFAMLGWQQNPDYKPMPHCFNYWHDLAKPTLTEKQIDDCEHHVKDLSRLYASYDVDAKPVVFKSNYYWHQKAAFDLAFPELVETWKAAGGKKDDTSYLKHPTCAKPLQQGWTGSDYFYDGRESPICRAHKIETIETLEKKQD